MANKDIIKTRSRMNKRLDKIEENIKEIHMWMNERDNYIFGSWRYPSIPKMKSNLKKIELETKKMKEDNYDADVIKEREVYMRNLKKEIAHLEGKS